MLVIAGMVSREPLPSPPLIAGRIHQSDRCIAPTAESARDDAQLLRRAQITEPSDGQFRVFLPRDHDPRRRTAARRQGRGGHRKPEDESPTITSIADGVTVKATRERVGGPIRVAVVGLGTGPSVLAEPGDSFVSTRSTRASRNDGARSELFPLSHRLRAGRPDQARRRTP